MHQDILSERAELIFRLNGVGVRDEWMPDPAIYMFVIDCLAYWHGRDPRAFPQNPLDFPSWWIPITIVGTLDWVVITTWWIWKETGFYNTDNPMDWVYAYMLEEGGIYHFPPKDILEFVNDPQRREQKFNYRKANPGIDDRERRSLINWLMRHNFPSWGLEPPPQQTVEQICWATLTWLVATHADDFYRQLDEMFVSLLSDKHIFRRPLADKDIILHGGDVELDMCKYCIFCDMPEDRAHFDGNHICEGNKMAHLGRFGTAEYEGVEIELLDEVRVIKTDQKKGTCTKCDLEAWCVRIDIADYDMSQFFLCRHCFVQALSHDEIGLNYHPDSEEDCFHCKNLGCQWHPRGEDGFWDEMQARGEMRLEEWNRMVEENGGLNPRIADGDAQGTIAKIVEYYTSHLLNGS